MAFKYVDDLATVWCEWAEMELRHKNFKKALELMRRATVPPVSAGARRTQEEIDGPVQGRLYRRCAFGRLLCPSIVRRAHRSNIYTGAGIKVHKIHNFFRARKVSEQPLW